MNIKRHLIGAFTLLLIIALIVLCFLESCLCGLMEILFLIALCTSFYQHGKSAQLMEVNIKLNDTLQKLLKQNSALTLQNDILWGSIKGENNEQESNGDSPESTDDTSA